MRRKKSKTALAKATAGRPNLQMSSYLVSFDYAQDRSREAYFVKAADAANKWVN